jgi:PPP family 3-phenylpropionic acid transporter
MSLSTTPAQAFSLRLSLFFAALFVLYGVQIPFFPVWLDWRGLTPAEIGAVTAAPLFLRIVIGPVAAFLADRSGDRRRAIIIAAGCGLAAVVALSQSYGLLLIALFTAAFVVGSQTCLPIGEAVALSGVRALGVDYGRMRLWGSLAFIVATFAGGALVESLGATSIVWMLVACSGGLLASAWLLPVNHPGAAGERPVTPGRRLLTPRDVVRVAASWRFLLFVAAAGLVQASHAVFYAFGVLHWQAQGLSSITIGVLWSLGVLAEILLFFSAGRFMALIGPIGFILAGAIAAVVRWGLMAFDPPLALLFPLQVLHGLTFGATHIGAMHHIHAVVPQEQAGTAQALFAAATGGIGMGAATLLAGMLYGPFGGLSYLAMMAMGVIGLIAAVGTGLSSPTHKPDHS